MSTNDTGGPAFPLPITRDPEGGIFDPRGYGAEGMTLRDYFAAQALAPWIQAHIDNSVDDLSMGEIARQCYRYADAMLKARSA